MLTQQGVRAGCRGRRLGALVVSSIACATAAAAAGDLAPGFQPLVQANPPRGSAPPAPKAEQGVFVADQLGSTCQSKINGPIIINLKIARYVGETQADGRLRFPDQMIGAGVIQATAALELPIWDIDSQRPPDPTWAPEVNVILVNGQRVGVLRGSDSNWRMNRFSVDIRHLRFPSGPGAAPANNEIRIDIDTGNSTAHWCTAVEWVALRLKAMAPVVLIHGNNSDPQFFERQGCTRGLREAHVPFALGPELPSASTESNGALLSGALPGLAQQFGSEGIHVIAHSKGGLDSRWALHLL